MYFDWLKRYMPRGIYGRAALILILPVVALQLVVFIVFIQRHFEDVTNQMTLTATRELQLVFEAIETASDESAAFNAMQETTDTLAMRVEFVAPQAIPEQDQLRWFDFTGTIVIRVLKTNLPQIKRVLLPDSRDVTVFAESTLGLVQLSFDRRRLSASNPHQLLVSMVFFSGLMTIISYIYMRNQLRPIKRLATASEAFGRGRHEPYSPSGALEVRAAGRAFVDMRARIELQIEQRTLMLSGVSHDLRTPLTRLRLGLSMLDGEDAVLLKRDVDDMQRLVDEFLDFAKGASEGEPEEADPQVLLAEIVADAKRSGKDVTIIESTGKGTVMLRTVAIRRAIENLIGNAVRYGTKAELSVVMTDKSLRFQVEDDGPGIPANQREAALRPFIRLDPSRNQDKGSGVGLGLAIAADVTRAHGGELRLGQSDRLGGLRADIVIAR
jgi:two-component system osmolarity sensor histidine kinase EnvZ